MSDLGNGGWPNSIKLGEDIDLDELLLNPVLFKDKKTKKKTKKTNKKSFFGCIAIFLSICPGESHFGVSEYKKTPIIYRFSQG